MSPNTTTHTTTRETTEIRTAKTTTTTEIQPRMQKTEIDRIPWKTMKNTTITERPHRGGGEEEDKETDTVEKTQNQ